MQNRAIQNKVISFDSEARSRPVREDLRGVNAAVDQKCVLALHHSVLYKPTGSQCEDTRSEVMWSTFLVLVRTGAAAF